MDATKSFYSKMVDRIQRAAFADKRFILKCLNTQIAIGPLGVTLSLAVPEKASEVRLSDDHLLQ